MSFFVLLTCDALGFHVLFYFFFSCVCVSPGKVDDVLDSICVVHHSRNSHRLVPVMVSQELVINELLI